MIYFVSNNPDKPTDERYEFMSVEDSLHIFDSVKLIQVDTETSGLNPHIKELMTLQLGSDVIDTQVVIDCTTVDVALYKSLLESKMLVLHNAKFDLQFFYKHNIIPRSIYDTMIAEQMLYLGYKAGTISYSLKEVANRYLHIDIDKTVRGQIRWRGVDPEVIIYGAGDVMHLEKIMWKQVAEANRQQCLPGIKIECEAVPAIAYMEWCGIHLDAEKWKKKIEEDTKKVQIIEEKLNDFIINLNNGDNPFCYLDPQGDLFTGFAEKPTCTINWDSPAQVIKLAKYLGFSTEVKDKKTGELKDSVLEKSLKIQKGINDEFLDLYFGYKEPKKALSAFGQGHLNAINPITGNLHTSWHQIGTASARMSCGEGTHPDEELAKLKGLPAKACPRVNLQQLPADDQTRGSFTSRPGYKIVSADYGAEESRLAADIYNEPVLLEEFLHGSGDAHSVFAKAFFPKELEGIEVSEVKEKRPDLRKRAKGPEFALSFGGGTGPIMSTLQCSKEEAQEIYDNYQKNMKATCDFAAKGAAFVKSHGYVLINPITGNRMRWQTWRQWCQEEMYLSSLSPSEQGEHRKEGAYWERMARNAVTQGSGSSILKLALKALSDYIVDNQQFMEVQINAAVHDEIVCTFPEKLEEFPKILEKIMEDAAAKLCKKLPIPAEASVGDHWIH